MINIGLCTDDNYAMPCGVCITSIFESNKSNSICIHLICENLSKMTVTKIESLVKKYNQQIKFYHMYSLQKYYFITQILFDIGYYNYKTEKIDRK